MIVISNREVQERASASRRFGEGFNPLNPSEIRVAEASYSNGWRVRVLPESPGDELPTKTVFRKVLARMHRYRRDCLVYVHGFNKSFSDVLEHGRDLERRYGVEVVIFTWPSNSGGSITEEYRRARAATGPSGVALDRAFDKLSTYLAHAASDHCEYSLNLLVHSLGCRLLEAYTREGFFHQHGALFSNVVLSAPDVDHERHAEWLRRLRIGRRTYVTINENDWVLRKAHSHTMQGRRLGHRASRPVADGVEYVNFTHASRVKNKHRLFEGRPMQNPKIRSFFQQALQGEEALADFEYDESARAYVVA